MVCCQAGYKACSQTTDGSNNRDEILAAHESIVNHRQPPPRHSHQHNVPNKAPDGPNKSHGKGPVSGKGSLTPQQER